MPEVCFPIFVSEIGNHIVIAQTSIFATQSQGFALVHRHNASRRGNSVSPLTVSGIKLFDLVADELADNFLTAVKLWFRIISADKVLVFVFRLRTVDVTLERCFHVRPGLSHLYGFFAGGDLLAPLRADADKYGLPHVCHHPGLTSSGEIGIPRPAS